MPLRVRPSAWRLAPGATVRIATDTDEDGAGFAAIIAGLVEEAGRGDRAVEGATPSDTTDWNDALRAASRVTLAIR